jgi:hypothetical protein
VGNEERALGVRRELQASLEKENLLWKQRAKTEWLKGGDRNSRYFHACANARRRKNRIDCIVDEGGQQFTSPEEIKMAFCNYFTGLFSSDSVGDANLCLQPLERMVSDDMNEDLLKPFQAEEVHSALFQMAPTKAPGPDGFPAGFYQKNWDVLGEDLCSVILKILDSGVMPFQLNATNIALIPKVKNPVSVSDYRPISICNVFYKVIFKVLANRMKKILPFIISPTQSAFIPGRLISDNVLVAYEALHTMHSRVRGKKGFMAIKLDMSKAYDRVEWGFLELVMGKLGFDERWIRLIMMCVRSVNYAILINGKQCGSISPERGLRQGNPISPYLFILCAEALSALVTKANIEGSLTGVSTSRRGPRISHLFFADDSLLFCRAELSQWNFLTDLLRTYKLASGQRLNNHKTSIFFSKNTEVASKEAILEVAGIPTTQRYDTYLGLPALVGKSRNTAFRGIVEKVRKRLQDWKLKFLSQAGKEILLKAVIQAIPTYCMSIFLLSKSLCANINSQMRKFWWGQYGKESGINWVSWENMGKPKAEGGMGFREFSSFNLALLAKQSWRLWSNPTSLIATIMKAKYYPNTSLFEAKVGRRPSYAWRSIHSSCDLLQDGLVWRVGNGETIRIWKDRWIPCPSTFRINSQPRLLSLEATVSELIEETTGWWNVQLLSSLFSEEEVNLILSIPPSSKNQKNILMWRGTTNGLFSVRSAYFLQQERVARGRPEMSSRSFYKGFWKDLWALPVPNSEKNFLWRATHEILPTRENLARRKIIDDDSYPLCGLEQESAFHILWQCPSAMDVWSSSCMKFQKASFLGPDFKQAVEFFMKVCSQEELAQFAGLVKCLWWRRNEVVHGGGAMR